MKRPTPYSPWSFGNDKLVSPSCLCTWSPHRYRKKWAGQRMERRWTAGLINRCVGFPAFEETGACKQNEWSRTACPIYGMCRQDSLVEGVAVCHSTLQGSQMWPLPVFAPRRTQSNQSRRPTCAEGRPLTENTESRSCRNQTPFSRGQQTRNRRRAQRA